MKIACAVLLATVALAQAPPEKKPAVIEGKVVNSVTGELIRKAELTLTTSLLPDGFEAMAAQMGLDDAVTVAEPGAKEPKKTFTAASDASGKFKFDHVDPGDYYFTVKHAGFVDQTYKVTGLNRSEGRLHLTAGQELHDVEFRLVPQGAVSGKVVDEDGDPVGDAMVSASKYSFASGRRRLQPADSAQTNDRGEFRLGKLPPGRYYLSAEVMGFNLAASIPPPPKDGSPEAGYVATYFPRTTDVQVAESVDVKAGGDIPGFVIHLQKSRVVRLKGKLVGADGSPLKQAQLMLMSGARPGSMRMTAVNNPEGTFELANVPPGTYMAMTMQMTGSTPSMTMQPLIVPNENLSDIKLGLAPEGTVQGKVTVAGDGKVAVKGFSVMLAGGDDAAIMPSTTAVDESGTFQLKKIASASYELTLPRVPAGAYLKSVLWNGREKLGESFDFSSSSAGDLQVILGTDGSTFDAKVSLGDKPASDATAVLLPAEAGRRNTVTTRSESTDDTGHAAFKDVPPGGYLVFAWEKVEDGDWFDPAFLKAAANDGVRVTIGPKDNQHLDLKAIPASK